MDKKSHEELLAASDAVLDEYAWYCICNWKNYTAFNPVKDENDFSELTRWFLWDKVGRALRRKYRHNLFEYENSLLEMISHKKSKKSVTPSLIRRLGYKLQLNYHHYICKKNLSCLQKSSKKQIYVPSPSDRLESPVSKIISQKKYNVSLAFRSLPGYKNAYLIPESFLLSSRNTGFNTQLLKAMIEGLKKLNVDLLPSDIDKLTDQVNWISKHIYIVEAQLKRLKPDLVLVHADNHPTPQEYILVANKLGIPTLMLQHGLDCEHFYLENAYAKNVAVWGSIRKERYQRNSELKPALRVTGNPAYDKFVKPEKIKTNGKYLLWTTRPHSPEKCYSVSRNVKEGVDIFNTLVDYVESQNEKLVVKPHPYDYISEYEKIISQRKLTDKIAISKLPLNDLIQNAKIVISEDSTAALDALIHGKLLILSHFASSKPTINAAEHGLALPGNSPEELTANLNLLLQSNMGKKNETIKSTQKFIENYTGSLDGKSGERFLQLIDDLLKD